VGGLNPTQKLFNRGYKIMVQLNYKASNIAKAEKEQGMSFFDVFSSLQDKPSISSLLFLFIAGGGTTEEFDELFKSGIDKVMLEVMSGIADAGFLGTTVDSKTLKAEMEKAMKEAMPTSEISGQTKKN